MKTSFQRFTPALVLIATLGFSAAHAQNTNPQNNTPVTATPAAPAVTKQVETGTAGTHKKHVNKEKHHNSAKKASDSVTAQTAKPASATPVTSPKS